MVVEGVAGVTNPKVKNMTTKTPYSGLIVKADHWVQYTVSPILSFNNDKDSLP
ncbi:MAG: hypothetical protein Ct9H300mP25_05290 [Acidobacteriota bacterium]|nr:MAG: hypothetical protein Ct9H300mP25_05290 [Acidobacteriota bacterium]